MRIAHINASDTQGGAAKAAFRLHEALQEIGHESRMFVARKLGLDDSVTGPTTPIAKTLAIFGGAIDGLPRRIYPNRTGDPFSIGWLGLPHLHKVISDFDPDVIHLHWVNGGLLTPDMLPAFGKPIVWSLHDMWPFTGGCHYSDDGCVRYRAACGRCPVLRSRREYDLSRTIWNRKKHAYSQVDKMIIVGLSRWLAREARQSSLFHQRRVANLPNPIDTRVFRPTRSPEARNFWGLPATAKIVLFGAMGAITDKRKGYDLLIEAMESIAYSDVFLCVFGTPSEHSKRLAGFPIRFLGQLTDEHKLASLYSAADVMVVPSRSEAFGQTASEAMSCGTPVVAFAATGLLDIVDHKRNGYLARPFESAELGAGIRWVVSQQDAGNDLGKLARQKVVETFDYPVVAAQYVKLYESILEA